MLVIGLTGGIGSGKSTVANHFAHYGINIVDADQISRDLVLPGSFALNKIQQHFGKGVLLGDGNLNRPQLREQIFNNKSDKIWLEDLLHPLVQKEASERLQKNDGPYSIYMSPLLIEKKLFNLIDRVLVVDLPEELQVERASKRDSNLPGEIEKIVSAQITRDERLAFADDIIDNSGSPQQLEFRVKELHKQYCRIANIKSQQ